MAQRQTFALGVAQKKATILKAQESEGLYDVLQRAFDFDPLCRDVILIYPNGDLKISKICEINIKELTPTGCTFLFFPKVVSNFHLKALRLTIGAYIYYPLKPDCTVCPLIIEEGQAVGPYDSDALLVRLGMFLIQFLKEISEQFLLNKLVSEKFLATLLILQYWQQIVKLKGSDVNLSRIFCKHLPSFKEACIKKNNILPFVLDLLDTAPKPVAAAAVAPDENTNVAIKFMIFIKDSVSKQNVSRKNLYELILFMFFVVNTANDKDINVSEHIKILQSTKDKVSAILNGIDFTDDDEYQHLIDIFTKLFKYIDREYLYTLLSTSAQGFVNMKLMHYVANKNSQGKDVVKTTTFATKPFIHGSSYHNIGQLTSPVVNPLQEGTTQIEFDKPNVTLALCGQVPVVNESFYFWFTNGNHHYINGKLEPSLYEPGANSCRVIIDKNIMTINISSRIEGQQKTISIEIGSYVPVCVFTFEGQVLVTHTPKAEVIAASAAAAPGEPGEPLPDAPGEPFRVIRSNIPLLPEDRIKYLEVQRAAQQAAQLAAQLAAQAAAQHAAQQAQQQAAQQAAADQPGAPRSIWVCANGSKRAGGGCPASYEAYLKAKAEANATGVPLWKFSCSSP